MSARSFLHAMRREGIHGACQGHMNFNKKREGEKKASRSPGKFLLASKGNNVGGRIEYQGQAQDKNAKILNLEAETGIFK